MEVGQQICGCVRVLSFLLQERLSIIRKVLVQEKELVSDRIVSIDRHYVRPIVRGKETKAGEFGAKVGNIQTDGISFIEHFSFKAFNEGIRLKRSGYTLSSPYAILFFKNIF